MANDIVHRLRCFGIVECHDGADEIERLRAVIRDFLMAAGYDRKELMDHAVTRGRAALGMDTPKQSPHPLGCDNGNAP